MQCNCSLNDNYQVIGLCDIENFNQKISQFIDKSWTQITISEHLTLPRKFPNIENITKIYLDINITSTKIINTPKSEVASFEGLTLTRKKLLVSGILCQTLVYVSATPNQSIHSVNFNVPFNTFIVIDENTDIDNDKFCIYPCVENVSVKPSSKRTLIKNVALFLFAHKIISPTPPPPTVNITNKFIFKSAFDEQMVTISFSSDKKLILISTTAPYDVPGSDEEAFIFQLLNPDGKTFRASASIKQNDDANNFARLLDNQMFEVGDLIVVKFVDKSKVTLTDYPSQGNTYKMIGKSGARIGEGQSFKITSTGIVPNILPNDIVLNDVSDNPVVTIQFDILFQKFLCNSYGTLSSTNFTMTLYHSDGSSRKLSSTISQNNSGNTFANTFNGFPFQWDDIIELEYSDNSKVTVTNSSPLPPSKKRFKITQSGLVDA